MKNNFERKRQVAVRKGATATEYAVVFALLLLAVLASIGVLGRQTGNLWGTVDANLVEKGHADY